MKKSKDKKVSVNIDEMDNEKSVHKVSIFKIILILILLMIVIPFVLILVYPIIILFILILIPIALVCIIFRGRKGTSIGLQFNFDLNNASLIDTHKNKEIKEGIDNILEYTKNLNKDDKEKED